MSDAKVLNICIQTLSLSFLFIYVLLTDMPDFFKNHIKIIVPKKNFQNNVLL